MFSSPFQAAPNPSSYPTYTNTYLDSNQPEFDLLHFLGLNDQLDHEDSTSSNFTACFSETPDNSMSSICMPRSNHMQEDESTNRVKMDGALRIAFRMKTELEIIDDGYKWRKYGKKMVKSSPNPRNYYKCSSGGCKVKKRVERDGEDSSYVITTYEGVHNHESPSMIYSNTMLPSGG